MAGKDLKTLCISMTLHPQTTCSGQLFPGLGDKLVMLSGPPRIKGACSSCEAP